MIIKKSIAIILIFQFLLMINCSPPSKAEENKFTINNFFEYVSKANTARKSWTDFDDKIQFKNTAFFVKKKSLILLDFIALHKKYKECYKAADHHFLIIQTKGKWGFKIGFEDLLSLHVNEKTIEINNYVPEHRIDVENDFIKIRFKNPVYDNFNKIALDYKGYKYIIKKSNGTFQTAVSELDTGIDVRELEAALKIAAVGN